jgi:hypothetical protein
MTLRVFRQHLRVIASSCEAIQGNEKDWIASAFALRASADTVVARAPRNDERERSAPLRKNPARMDADGFFSRNKSL